MFVCGPEKDAKKRNNVLNDRKQLVDGLGDDFNIVPCLLSPAPTAAESPCISYPYKIVCHRCELIEKNDKRKNGRSKKPAQRRSQRAKSRELRASILYSGCDCEKRNGLQDDCRRTGCHGSPECLTKPEPICGPSEFSNGKHLGRKYNAAAQGTGGTEEAGDDEGNCKTYYLCNCVPDCD